METKPQAVVAKETTAEAPEGNGHKLLQEVAQETAARGAAMYDRMKDPLAAAREMGKAFAASGLFGVKNEAQGYILALACIYERRNPIDAARRYHIIADDFRKTVNLALDAAALHADFLEDNGRVQWMERTAEAVEGIFSHPKYQPNGVKVRVTLDELKASGVAMGKNGVKANYKRHPRQMLTARCISEGVSAANPRVRMGYTPEELQDEIREQAPTGATTPTPQQKAEDAAKPDLSEIASKAAEAFKALGIELPDVEAYLAPPSGPAKPITEWTDKDIAELRVTKKLILAKPKDERTAEWERIVTEKHGPERETGQEG